MIGAGAAGLAASIFAAETAVKGNRPQKIALLDGVKTIGAKILISGGGRCNVTHQTIMPSDYFGNRNIIKHVLASYSVEQTVEWFASLGVQLKREETNKLFPVTDKAQTVLNALVGRCRELGVSIRSNHRVTDVQKLAKKGFVLQHSQGTLQANRVILATGGRSVPKSGSDGFGYELARRLGHRITATAPALVPLVLDDKMFHKMLSGLSQEVELTTIVKGHKVDRRTGRLLWTHFGISGPVVMDASRFWCLAQAQEEAVVVYGNFLPDQTQEQVRRWFIEQARANSRRSLIKILGQAISERFVRALCGYVKSDPQTTGTQLLRRDRERLIEVLTRFEFPIVRDRGWNFAEVTAGGIALDEVNFRTMESKFISGLYLVGEILDCDGRIGGFNFQWAWATGWLAGRAVASQEL